MKINLYIALVIHYKRHIDEAVATLEIYFHKSVGIGEHSDLLLELKKYTELLDSADSKLSTLKKYFNDDGSIV
jgi:hypothetical protein